MGSENQPVTGILQRVYSESPELNKMVAPERIELRGVEVTMGRTVGSTVVWPSIQVSRRHAVMEYQDNTWRLRDLSTNGLAVNGRKIKKDELVDLNHSDLITFIPTGALVYQFFPVKIPPTITLDSSMPSPELAQQSSSPIRSTTSNSVKSPKRKTNSGLSNSIEQDRKRKRVLFNNSSHVSNNEELVDLESDPEFFTVLESPPPQPQSSCYSPSSSGQWNDKSVPTESQDDDCIEDESSAMARVKEKLTEYQERIRELEYQNNKLRLEKNREVSTLKSKISVAQSECRTFKDELFNQLMEVMENEFSCCICNEIFIQATVVDCGHTFCAHCISEWVKRKPECPNCRKHVRIQVKHVEMENFVMKLHTMFSDEIRKRRAQIIEDRNREVRQVKVAASASARSTNSTRGGRGNRQGVDFSFAPDSLVDFLNELQHINQLFVPPNRRPPHHVGDFPQNLSVAAPEVGNLPPGYLPPSLHHQLLASRAAHMAGADRSRRRSNRIRGGSRSALPPGGAGRGNPPNIPLEIAHMPEFAIAPMDILTVD